MMLLELLEALPHLRVHRAGADRQPLPDRPPRLGQQFRGRADRGQRVADQEPDPPKKGDRPTLTRIK